MLPYYHNILQIVFQVVSAELISCRRDLRCSHVGCLSNSCVMMVIDIGLRWVTSRIRKASHGHENSKGD